MEDFTTLSKKLEQILEAVTNNTQINKLIEEIELLTLTEMAAREGNDGTFEYYILDNEMYSHSPHIHICVPKNDKHWKGKPLRSGNPFKTVASVKLKMDNPYDIEFEQIMDPKIDNNSNKKVISKWLQSKKLGITNHIKCLNDYLLQNNDFVNRQQYQQFIDRLG